MNYPPLNYVYAVTVVAERNPEIEKGGLDSLVGLLGKRYNPQEPVQVLKMPAFAYWTGLENEGETLKFEVWKKPTCSTETESFDSTLGMLLTKLLKCGYRVKQEVDDTKKTRPALVF